MRTRALTLAALPLTALLLTACEGKLSLCENDKDCKVKLTTGEEEIEVDGDIKLKVTRITDDSVRISLGSQSITAREDDGKFTLGKLKIRVDNADGKTHRAQLTIDY